VSRLLRSPGLVSLIVALAFGIGAVRSQDDPKKPEKLPFPRVVSDPAKTKPDTPTKNKEEPASKKEEPAVKKEEPKKAEAKKDEPKKDVPKKDEPKAPLTFEPVKGKDEPKKDEPKKEEAKAEEPKKEEAKEEAKKEDPKPDPIAELKTAVEKADGKGSDGIKRGDNAWVLTASALVLLMTPGLALFYGGMVRKKNILATMMQSYAAMGVVGIYWVAIGYGLAFGPSAVIAPDALATLLGGDAAKGGGMIGWDWKLFFLQEINPTDTLPGYNVPVYTHVMFQGMFAIITPALISGAIAERIRFWPWVIFMILWVTFVYCPLAHMVWAFDWFYADPVTAGKDLGATAVGLLGKAGALDFAGGTVVHIAAGFAGLACIFVLRKRTGYPEHAMHPNSMVITLIGAGLLWFGWFGFNGGSALNASDLATTGFATTQCAAAAAALTWCLIEWIFKGKPTALGLASGVVAGLVAVTPASGYVLPWGGALIGVAASVVCYFAVQIKSLLGYDDSLDAFGVHGVGGFLGAVLTGFFSYAIVQSASADGYVAHMRLEKNLAALKAEPADLTKQIDEIKKTEAGLKKASDEAAAKVETAKEGKEKDDAQKAADTAKADFEEVARKVKRREDRIAAIGKPKASLGKDEAPGDIAKLEDKIEGYKKDEKGPWTQPKIQFKAASFSAIFAFSLSLGLCFLVQLITLGNFRTSVPDENEGLDQTEHGETGFDFGGIDTLPTVHSREPKAAKMPPGGKRFAVVVEGIENGGLMTAWSQLCQPKDGPLDADFKAVYPYVTTVQGNRFNLRGGDPKVLSASIQKLFTKKLGKPLKVRIEE
jgi:ammonium transporter, Amt family